MQWGRGGRFAGPCDFLPQAAEGMDASIACERQEGTRMRDAILLMAGSIAGFGMKCNYGAEKFKLEVEEDCREDMTTAKV